MDLDPQAGDVFRWIGNIGLFLSAAIATWSVILHAQVPWRRTTTGRHLMAYMAVVALVLILAMIRAIFGDTAWFALLRLGVFVIGVPFILAWRVRLQLRARREDRAGR